MNSTDTPICVHAISLCSEAHEVTFKLLRYQPELRRTYKSYTFLTHSMEFWLAAAVIW